MTEILVHDVPEGRLPDANITGALLELFPNPKTNDKATTRKTPKQQESVLPRDNQAMIVLGTEDGEVTAAAIGVISNEVAVMRISLLRGTSPDAVLGVVGALLEKSRDIDTVNTVFADAIVTARNEKLLTYAGFTPTTNSHYPMPAGMSFSV